MRLTPGQATRKAAQGAAEAAGRAGRLVHGLVQLAVVLGLVALTGIAVLSVRLAQGPLPIAGLARQIALAASDANTNVTVGSADLTWEGLHGGLDRPLDIVLHDVVLRNADGATRLQVARAEVSLSPFELLFGRVVPRAVALDQPILNMVVPESENPAATPPDWRAQLAQTLQFLRIPLTSAPKGPALLGQLRRIKLNHAQMALRNAPLGFQGDLSDVNIDLLRSAPGGASFHIAATLKLGGGEVEWRASGELLANTGDLVIGLAIDRFNPAWLAADSALLAPLNLAQLPLMISATARLDPQLGLHSATLDVTADRGTLLLGEGAMPIRHATLHADITPETLSVLLRDATLQATDNSTPTHIRAQIAAKLLAQAQDHLGADINVDIDQVAVDDLAIFWPLGIGGPGTRPWLVANAHNGTLRNAHVALNLTAPTDFSDAVMTKIVGGMEGSDISISWLAPVPPVEHAGGHMVFVDPDTMDIFVTTGQQAGTKLVTNRGKIRMTGLAGHDQFMALDADLAGPFADLVHLLHHKRIGLLDQRPIPINDPTGQITGKLSINMPLKNSLVMEEVAIHGSGKLADAHIGGIAAGRDAEHVNVSFDVSNAGLNLSGSTEVLSVPVQVTAMMDFRPGGPTEVLEKVDATASLSAEQLTKLNGNPDQALSGSTGVHLIYQERRGGRDDLALAVDLTNAAIADKLVSWSKTAGTPGQAALHVELRGGKIITIDDLRADAPGLTLRAHADADAGKPNLVHVDALKLGDTTDVSGTLRLAASADAPFDLALSGHALDVSGLLSHHDADRATKGPIYHLNLQVDRMTLANRQVWKDVAAELASDGWITTSAKVSAQAGSGTMRLSIAQQPGGREMHATAQDAGAMLTALDVSRHVEGGTLAADGRYDDSNTAHTLSGTATLENFRLPNAPVIGQFLQALSVYGIFEATSGAGLSMMRLTAPFDLTSDTLTLKDARAISASLGFTSKGTVDLNSHVANIEGTVIPAYFFNSLLGRLPLVGKLFSPEAEGGLLALGFSIRGSLDDPSVTVNPLSAVTPGILRRFFDMFPPSTNAPPPAPATP